MCKIVSIENIISSHFLTHKEDKEVDFQTLSKYKCEIENKFYEQNEFVYVDNTRDAWLNAMNHNRDFFRINDDSAKVEFIGDANHLKQWEPYFNARLPFRKESGQAIYESVFTQK
jgi:hypothetical protein